MLTEGNGGRPQGQRGDVKEGNLLRQSIGQSQTWDPSSSGSRRRAPETFVDRGYGLIGNLQWPVRDICAL